MLQRAFTGLQETSSAPSRSVATTLANLGLDSVAPETAQEVQQQQAEAGPSLPDAQASLAQIPGKIRLMVVAFTLYYWNVPLSRIAVWMGVSPSTVLNWSTGLAVVMFPVIHDWIVTTVTATSLAVDEKWLKITKRWQSWFVAVDEATGLPVGMSLLPTRMKWACTWFLLTVKRLGLRPRAVITDGLDSYTSPIRTLFPTATHILCLFHHQQGVTRWLRDHVRNLPKPVIVTLKRKMERVVQISDPRTVLRCLARLTKADGAQVCGLKDWIAQIVQKVDRLTPALRDNGFPRTTNSVERFFRAFQRFYKTWGGFHSVRSAKRELMLFVVGYVFTVSPETGRTPIEQLVPQANQMPFFQLVNAPFRSGLLHICQAKLDSSANLAT